MQGVEAPPPASPTAADSSTTYAYGADAGDLAARARELGLERRAALLERSRDTHNLYAGTLKATRLRLAVLASYDPDLDDVDWHEGQARPLQPRGELERTPSWLRVVEARREARRSGGAGFTLFQAFLATVKSAVGPAVLYMPKGFEEGGLAFSLGMLLLSYALFGLGATRLLESWTRERRSYAGLMGKAFGVKGVYLCRVTIVLQQCGICLTYFIFVATNLRELCAYFTGATPSLVTCCLVQLGAYVPLSWIRNMQNFATTNLVANACILYSLAVLAAFATLHIERNPPPLTTLRLFNREAFYLFVGTSAFVYEGSAALVVPLQEAVRPDLRDRFQGMYIRTCGGIIATYICFGALNWAAYGRDTQTVLTVNLPRGPWKASVQIAYTLAVVFTFPLQLFPAVQILKSVGRKLKRLSAGRPCSNGAYVAIGDGPGTTTTTPLGEAAAPGSPSSTDGEATPAAKPPRPRTSKFEGNVARTVVVVALCGVAVVEVQNLDKLVALVGGFLGIPLAFVYPLAIHLKLVPDASAFTRGINKTCMVVGISLALACSGVTVATW